VTPKGSTIKIKVRRRSPENGSGNGTTPMSYLLTCSMQRATKYYNHRSLQQLPEAAPTWITPIYISIVLRS